MGAGPAHGRRGGEFAVLERYNCWYDLETFGSLLIPLGRIKAEVAVIEIKLLVIVEPEQSALFAAVWPYAGSDGAAGLGSLPGPQPQPPLACAE